MSKKLPLSAAWNKRKKLYSEGNKLHAEGDIIWLNSVIEWYGNIQLEWISTQKCKLENGDTYE